YARLARNHEARLQKRDRRLVIDRFSIERAKNRDVVDHLRGVWQQLRQPCPALTMLRKFENRRRDREPALPRCHRRQPLSRANSAFGNDASTGDSPTANNFFASSGCES